MHSWELFDPPFLGTLVNDTLWAAVEHMDNLRMRCSQLDLDDLRTTESQTASKNLTYSSSATRNLWAKQLCMSFTCRLHVFCMCFAMSFACPLHVLVLHSMDWGSKAIILTANKRVRLGQLAQCCLLRYYFEVSKPAETRQSGMLARLPNQKSNIWNVIHGTPCRSHLPGKVRRIILWKGVVITYLLIPRRQVEDMEFWDVVHWHKAADTASAFSRPSFSNASGGPTHTITVLGQEAFPQWVIKVHDRPGFRSDYDKSYKSIT